MKKLLTLLFLSIFLIGIVSAFDLQKHLVQIEVDENYPCHIENSDTIVCPAIDNIQINNWKNKIDNLKPEEKDMGNWKDKDKKILLDAKMIPYVTNKQTKHIQIDKEYREKINPQSLSFDDTIKIGFGTNVFGVSGTPLENFDVNTTTGMVRYRPLNMTWMISQTNNYISFNNPLVATNNYTISIWYRNNSNVKGVIWQGSYTKLYTFGDNLYFMGNATNNMSVSLSLLNEEFNNIIIASDSYAGNISMYVNGILVNQSLIKEVSGFPAFSQIRQGSGNQLNFSIDEIRAYSIVLNSEEVTILYNNQRKLNSSLFGSSRDNYLYWYFPIDETSGTSFNNLGNTTTTQTWGNGGGTFKNDGINITTTGYWVNISIANITNALIFWDNYTLINFSTSANKTFEFLNNQTIWILENYKVNQSNMNSKSPIWYSISNSTTRHIASNLSDTINASIIINPTGITCTQAKNITYRTNAGVVTEWLLGTAQSVCTNLTTSGQYLSIEPATSSNTLDMEFDTTPPVITVVSPIATRYDIISGIIINFSATDETALDSLWYSINNGVNTSFTTQVSLPFSKGSYTMFFYANDTSNNLVQTSVSFTVGISSRGFCSVVTSGYSNFFSTVIVIFGILAVAIIIGFLFMLILAANGQDIPINKTLEVLGEFDVRAVMLILLAITILVWVIMVIFGSLCETV